MPARYGQTQQFEPTRSLLAGTTGPEPHLRGPGSLQAADSEIGSPTRAAVAGHWGAET